MQENPQIDQQVSLGAFKKVFELNKLLLKAGALQSRKELIFFILNETIRYTPYNRAMLWEFPGRARCLGVSGHAVFDEKSPVLSERGSLIDALDAHTELLLLSAELFPDDMKDQWSNVQQEHSGTSVLWCPLIWDGQVVAGLWLERWGAGVWNSPDQELIRPLIMAYASAWRPYLRSRTGLRGIIRKRRTRLAVSGVFIALLFFVRIPLRIVAPCEVVPKDPVVVAAPLDGVIDRVLVHPGDLVESGQLLFSYDKEIPLQDLKVARQQVRLIWSDLERARAEAFRSAESKQLVALLETRLEQEQSQLELSESYAQRLDVTAAETAVIMMGDPGEWTGRPVAVGEKVLQLIDPERSKLMIWLPQDDKIAFDEKQQVRVILNAHALHTQYAMLSYQAQHAEMSPAGYSAFLAEADWVSVPDGVQMGLKGHAVLYGKKVSLAYWLFRRPLAAIRVWIGR